MSGDEALEFGFGLDLDFVNLRAEEYADSSRIPTKMVRERLLHLEIMYISVKSCPRLSVRRCKMRSGVIQQSMPCFTTCTPDS